MVVLQCTNICRIEFLIGLTGLLRVAGLLYGKTGLFERGWCLLSVM
jgi:hypothetical protein